MLAKQPEDAPTGIDLDEVRPQGRNPIPRLFYVGAAMLAITFVLVMVGLIHRGHARQAEDRAKVNRELATEPASSSRQNIEASTTAATSAPVPANTQQPVNATVPPGTSPIAPIPMVNGVQQNLYQPGMMMGQVLPAAYEAPAPAQQLDPVAQAEQDAEVKAMRDEEAARTAPTTVKLNDSTPQNVVAPTPADVAQLASLLRPNEPVGTDLHTGEHKAKVGQEQKIAFGNETNEKAPDDYLHATRTDPVSRFELQQGTRIPAITDEKALSDIPGEITAVVRNDVMDSLTGKYVLIPKGSRLIGEYNSTVSYGQNRLQIVWTRVLFPDTTYLDLGRMNAHAADGASGLHDKTNAHWLRTIGGVALSSILSAGFQLSQNRAGNSSVLGYPSTGQVIAGAIGQQASQLGQELTERNLNVQPSLKIRTGEQFFVFVKRDLIFDAPYEARL